MCNNEAFNRGKRIMSFGRIIVQYGPLVTFTVMLVHVILLFFGIDMTPSKFLFISSLYGCIVMVAASLSFGFCRLHRSLILYSYAISFCITFQEEIGFGALLWTMRIMALVCGLAILTCLVAKRFKI